MSIAALEWYEKSGAHAGLFCYRIFASEPEVLMQTWPYADFGYIDVEYFRSMPQGKDAAHRREHLIVQAVFPSASGNIVIFCDHYAEEYRSQRSELDEYLAKLNADG